MTAKNVEIVTASGTESFIPLNKLKKSPKNARKTPHSEASIEAYAASIAAKGILQNLVVEPELDTDGAATGFYFVTIGEGRRQAQLLRIKRKEIKKTEPIRCVIGPLPVSTSSSGKFNESWVAFPRRVKPIQIAAESRALHAPRFGRRQGLPPRQIGQARVEEGRKRLHPDFLPLARHHTVGLSKKRPPAPGVGRWGLVLHVPGAAGTIPELTANPVPSPRNGAAVLYRS
jgi:ParB family chromosome partitioning protein